MATGWEGTMWDTPFHRWLESLPWDEQERISRELFRKADRRIQREALEDALRALGCGQATNWTFQPPKVGH